MTVAISESIVKGSSNKDGRRGSVVKIIVTANTTSKSRGTSAA